MGEEEVLRLTKKLKEVVAETRPVCQIRIHLWRLFYLVVHLFQEDDAMELMKRLGELPIDLDVLQVRPIRGWSTISRVTQKFMAGAKSA